MWEFVHAVKVEADVSTAWAFWTDTANWAIDPAVEWARLDGPFEAGTTGATKSAGEEPRHWRLSNVVPHRAATIEMQLPEALLRFDWSFEPTSRGHARVTQRISFHGPRADDYVERTGSAFEQGVPQGMARLAAAIRQFAATHDAG